MDRKSKLLLTILVIITIASIAYSFYKYVISKDYIITAHIACDPTVDSCFYVPCDGSDCPTETEYYKTIYKKASNVALCDTAKEDCNALVCETGEIDCQIISCTADDLADGETCSTPDPVIPAEEVSTTTDQTI